MKNILIAETNPVTQQVLEITFTDLQDFDGEVRFADTPDEALDLIRIHKPDLFLASDSQEFPNLDELIGDIRKIDVSENIPIIAIFSPEKPVASKDPQVYKMRKPFSAIKLLGLIKDLLNGKIDAGIDDLYFKPSEMTYQASSAEQEKDEPEMELKDSIFAEMAALIDDDDPEEAENPAEANREEAEMNEEKNPFAQAEMNEEENSFAEAGTYEQPDSKEEASEQEMKEDEYKTTALSNPFLSALKEMEEEL